LINLPLIVYWMIVADFRFLFNGKVFTPNLFAIYFFPPEPRKTLFLYLKTGKSLTDGEVRLLPMER
ncbi:MAG: hypothetical protein Q4A50_10055, partial [Bacteroidales bacterium]|nr:hypothetical protein [Bacteroidales bacterium]